MKRRFSRLGLSIVSLFLAINASMLFAYAYFENQSNYGFDYSIGDIEVTAYISFDGTYIDTSSPYYDYDNHSIIINADDPLSENYIGNLSVDIQINPNVVARARIKVLDEWELTRTYTDAGELYPIDPVVETVYLSNQDASYHPYSLFLMGDGYHPIYDDQGYGYLSEVLNKNVTTTIHLIDGGSMYPVKHNDIYSESCSVHLKLVVDVIQANRFPELWGLDSTFFSS